APGPLPPRGPWLAAARLPRRADLARARRAGLRLRRLRRLLALVLPAADALGGGLQPLAHPLARRRLRGRLGRRVGVRRRVVLAADELHLRDLGAVAAPEADAQQPRIAARPLGEPRRDLREELADHAAVLDVLQHEATGG